MRSNGAFLGGNGFSSIGLPYPRPDFEMQLTNDVGIQIGSGAASFTRASKATYIKNGVLTLAEIDEPRFEKEGILIEGASTNYVNTADLTNTAYWRVNPELSVRFEEHLDGFDFYRVDRVTPNVSFKAMYTYPSLTLTGSGGKDITCSAVFKKEDTSISLAMFFNGGSTNGVMVQVSLSTGAVLFNGQTGDTSLSKVAKVVVTDLGDKYRVTITSASLGGKSRDSVRVYIYPEFYSQQTNKGYSVAAVQVEALPFASSYIPTDGAPATRVGDLAIVDLDLPGGDCTLSFTHDRLGPMQYPRIVETHMNTIRNLFSDWRENGSVNFGINDSSKIIQTNSALATNPMSTTLVYSNTAIKGYSNGAASAIKEDNTPVTPSNKVSLGTTIGGGNPLWGHIKDFRIWNKALTPEQVSMIK